MTHVIDPQVVPASGPLDLASTDRNNEHLKEYLNQIDHLEARFGDLPPRPRFGGLLTGGYLIAFTACACKGPWWTPILLTAVFVPLFFLIYYDANSKKGGRKRSRDGPRDLEVSPKVKDLLEALKDKSESPSLSEVFKKSLAVFGLILDHTADGGKVVLEDRDGNREVLKIV